VFTADGRIRRLSKLKALREPSGRTRYLTDAEEERLLNALASTFRALVSYRPRSLDGCALVFPNTIVRSGPQQDSSRVFPSPRVLAK